MGVYSFFVSYWLLVVCCGSKDKSWKLALFMLASVGKLSVGWWDSMTAQRLSSGLSTPQWSVEEDWGTAESSGTASSIAPSIPVKFSR